MGVIQANLQGILQKEVSRKDFLSILALAIASILGFSTIVKLLTGKSLESHRVLHDYGASSYGGSRNNGNGVGL